MSTQKRTRCKKGTRKNKKSGNCESVLDKYLCYLSRTKEKNHNS